jgi:hypothetical protein
VVWLGIVGNRFRFSGGVELDHLLVVRARVLRRRSVSAGSTTEPPFATDQACHGLGDVGRPTLQQIPMHSRPVSSSVAALDVHKGCEDHDSDLGNVGSDHAIASRLSVVSLAACATPTSARFGRRSRLRPISPETSHA